MYVNDKDYIDHDFSLQRSTEICVVHVPIVEDIIVLRIKRLARFDVDILACGRLQLQLYPNSSFLIYLTRSGSVLKLSHSCSAWPSLHRAIASSWYDS